MSEVQTMKESERVLPYPEKSKRKLIFDYVDYKLYLKDFMSCQPNDGRGLKAKVAQIIGCNTSYVSQVLGGLAHFSLEQADDLNKFFGHSKDEAQFFLIIVQRTRAGSISLRKFFDEQIEVALQKRMNLKDRVGIQRSLNSEDQALYYSAWYYAAIHLLPTIPGYDTCEAISDYFKMPRERVQQVLDFLTAVGLISKLGEKYFVGVNKIYLDKGSPMISRHHTNWRMKAIQSLDQSSQDLHYSSAVTLSKADALRIHSDLIGHIEELKQRIKVSPEEELYCFNLDFFRID